MGDIQIKREYGLTVFGRTVLGREIERVIAEGEKGRVVLPEGYIGRALGGKGYKVRVTEHRVDLPAMCSVENLTTGEIHFRQTVQQGRSVFDNIGYIEISHNARPDRLE